MTTRTIAFVVLLLAPAGLAYLSGFREQAHYLALGSALALQLSVLARPVAVFAFLLPVLYAMAAITAAASSGVVALVAAVAAMVGAASSQGLHRGMIALLAVTLLGSLEPAGAADVLQRAGLLLLGVAYGFTLAVTALRDVRVDVRCVLPGNTLGYAMLIAVLAILAWFAAQLSGLPHAWWLPLAVAAVGQPVVFSTAGRSLLRVAAALCATLLLVWCVDSVNQPMLRAALLVAILLVAFSAGRRRPNVIAVLMPPALVLLANHGPAHESPLDYAAASLLAFLPVLALVCLGQWLYWVLRSESDRAPA